MHQQQRGISMIEVMIALVVAAILAAVTIPSMKKSREAGQEGAARSKLSMLSASQSVYRAAMGKNRYGTLAELRNTSVAGAPLVSPADLDASGVAVPHDGWIIEQLEAPTETTYGVGVRPVAANSSTYRYAVFEDGVIRYGLKGSTITRTSNPF
jgi:prepilin-type N-terminal cleavage/methylation domain-containing protein